MTVKNAETEVVEAEEVERIEQPEGEMPEVVDEQDEEVITLGDSQPPTEDAEHKEAPEWVKELRRKSREDAKRLKELERQLQEATKAKEQPKIELPKKPKLSDPDIDYDDELFERRLDEWKEAERQYKAEQAKIQSAQKAEQDAWQEKLKGYAEAKKTLRVSNADEAESVVVSTLSEQQQAILLDAADSPDQAARIVYALGMNDERLKKLSEIKSPVKFAVAVADLRKELKVTTRKPEVQPEKKVVGGGKSPVGIAANLDELRKRAGESGDYSDYIAAKRRAK